MHIDRYRKGAALIALCIPVSGIAALGDTVNPAPRNQASMKAAGPFLSATGSYTIHESNTPAGVSVREFASADGRIFAVAWQGPVQPDLRQLLGSYFPHYLELASARAVNRRHMQVQDSGLVVQSSGSMRAFLGRAYLPQQLPAGVSIDELR